jgi:predicted PurR-regulated permease PerM
MKLSRVIEYVFFFALLGLAGYMVWQMMAPFVSALALAAIIVVICYPMYEKILPLMPKQSKNIAAFVSTLIVMFVIVLPLVILSSFLAREIIGFVQTVESGDQQFFEQGRVALEQVANRFFPEFEFNLSNSVSQGTQWFAGNLPAIFAGTLSTIVSFFIALIGSFYFFRDGRELMQLVIKASPLPDKEDRYIFSRLATAVRAVVTGTVSIALIQGLLAAFGFTIFGIEQAVLLGSLTAIVALIPGIGTPFITIPVVLYLFVSGDLTNAFGLLIWSIVIVSLVDNLVGPYLIGRGNNMHPFIILIAVLGGLIYFGPIGFIVGPVIVTLFMSLLELYHLYIVKEQRGTSQSKT